MNVPGKCICTPEKHCRDEPPFKQPPCPCKKCKDKKRAADQKREFEHLAQKELQTAIKHGQASPLQNLRGPVGVGYFENEPMNFFVTFILEILGILAFLAIATIMFWVSIAYYTVKLAYGFKDSDRNVKYIVVGVSCLLMLAFAVSLVTNKNTFTKPQKNAPRLKCPQTNHQQSKCPHKKCPHHKCLYRKFSHHKFLHYKCPLQKPHKCPHIKCSRAKCPHLKCQHTKCLHQESKQNNNKMYKNHSVVSKSNWGLSIFKSKTATKCSARNKGECGHSAKGGCRGRRIYKDCEARSIYQNSKRYAVPTEMKQPPTLIIYLRDMLMRVFHMRNNHR